MSTLTRVVDQLQRLNENEDKVVDKLDDSSSFQQAINSNLQGLNALQSKENKFGEKTLEIYNTVVNTLEEVRDSTVEEKIEARKQLETQKEALQRVSKRRGLTEEEQELQQDIESSISELPGKLSGTLQENLINIGENITSSLTGVLGMFTDSPLLQSSVQKIGDTATRKFQESRERKKQVRQTERKLDEEQIQRSVNENYTGLSSALGTENNEINNINQTFRSLSETQQSPINIGAPQNIERTQEKIVQPQNVERTQERVVQQQNAERTQERITTQNISDNNIYSVLENILSELQSIKNTLIQKRTDRTGDSSPFSGRITQQSQPNTNAFASQYATGMNTTNPTLQRTGTQQFGMDRNNEGAPFREISNTLEFVKESNETQSNIIREQRDYQQEQVNNINRITNTILPYVRERQDLMSNAVERRREENRREERMVSAVENINTEEKVETQEDEGGINAIIPNIGQRVKAIAGSLVGIVGAGIGAFALFKDKLILLKDSVKNMVSKIPSLTDIAKNTKNLLSNAIKPFQNLNTSVSSWISHFIKTTDIFNDVSNYADDLFKQFSVLRKLFGKTSSIIGKVAIPIAATIETVQGMIYGGDWQDKVTRSVAGILSIVTDIPELAYNYGIRPVINLFGTELEKIDIEKKLKNGLDSIWDFFEYIENVFTNMKQKLIRGLKENVLPEQLHFLLPEVNTPQQNKNQKNKDSNVQKQERQNLGNIFVNPFNPQNVSKLRQNVINYFTNSKTNNQRLQNKETTQETQNKTEENVSSIIQTPKEGSKVEVKTGGVQTNSTLMNMVQNVGDVAKQAINEIHKLANAPANFIGLNISPFIPQTESANIAPNINTNINKSQNKMNRSSAMEQIIQDMNQRMEQTVIPNGPNIMNAPTVNQNNQNTTVGIRPNARTRDETMNSEHERQRAPSN